MKSNKKEKPGTLALLNNETKKIENFKMYKEKDLDFLKNPVISNIREREQV